MPLHALAHAHTHDTINCKVTKKRAQNKKNLFFFYAECQ